MASKTQKHITIAGDTFDKIAYQYYGDEHLCDKVMVPARETFETVDVESDFPDWRTVLNG